MVRVEAQPAEPHFRSVVVWAVVLFVLQLTGIQQALGPVPALL